MYRLGNRILTMGDKLFRTIDFNPIWSGLTSYWRFEENTGTTAYDSVGSYYGTFGGNTLPIWDTGIHNYGVTMKGSGASNRSYITILNNGYESSFATQTFTISGWVNCRTGIYQNIMWSFDYTSVAPPYYAQHIRVNSDGGFGFLTNRGGVSTTIYYAKYLGANIQINTWYHLVMTVTTTRGRAYINGNMVGENTTDTGNITYYNQEVFIGGNNMFNGVTNFGIDEVGFWNRELSKDEVKSLYNAGNGIYY